MRTLRCEILSMEKITSKQNPRIKNLVRLHSSRGRQKQNRIAVFGSREILRALGCGVVAEEFFVCHEQVDPDALSLVQQHAADFSVAWSIDSELFEKVCFGNRKDGLIMTASRPAQSIDDVFQKVTSSSPLIAVVESIEKPGNLGAILRSADGAGIDAVIVADALTDWFHPNTIRSSLGTCFSIPGCVASSEETQQRLRAEGYQVVVANLEGAKDFHSLDLTVKTAIVLGNEANGVSQAWRREEFHAAKLPMMGIADSLNVSATAAAMFYEARRQRSSN